MLLMFIDIGFFSATDAVLSTLKSYIFCVMPKIKYTPFHTSSCGIDLLATCCLSYIITVGGMMNSDATKVIFYNFWTVVGKSLNLHGTFVTHRVVMWMSSSLNTVH